MGAFAMKWQAKLVIFEPFEAEEEIYGEVVNLFLFKADDGRRFIIFPRYGIFEFIKFLKCGKIIVNVNEYITKNAYLGDLQRC